MKKVSKHFKLPDGLVYQVKELSHSKSISETEFVTRAIEYFIKNKGADYIGLYAAINQMLENHQRKTNDEIIKIRHAVNQIAKESQMSVEFWNTYFNEKGNGSLLLTDVNKTNEVALAESSVQSRISDMQQKKYR